VGADAHKTVVGKKSGRPSITYKMGELGLSAPEEKIDQILARVKKAGIELKRTLTDDEFRKIVEDAAGK
jgi:isopropylmalate/homocitrate/citramalate synthase